MTQETSWHLDGASLSGGSHIRVALPNHDFYDRNPDVCGCVDSKVRLRGAVVLGRGRVGCRFSTEGVSRPWSAGRGAYWSLGSSRKSCATPSQNCPHHLGSPFAKAYIKAGYNDHVQRGGRKQAEENHDRHRGLNLIPRFSHSKCDGDESQTRCESGHEDGR